MASRRSVAFPWNNTFGTAINAAKKAQEIKKKKDIQKDKEQVEAARRENARRNYEARQKAKAQKASGMPAKQTATNTKKKTYTLPNATESNLSRKLSASTDTSKRYAHFTPNSALLNTLKKDDRQTSARNKYAERASQKTYINAEKDINNWTDGTDVGADRFLMAKKDQEKLNTIKSNWRTAYQKKDTEAMNAAHNAAEALRKTYGYYGGANGGAFNRVTGLTSSGKVLQGVNSANLEVGIKKTALDELEKAGKKDTAEYKRAQKSLDDARVNYTKVLQDATNYWDTLSTNNVDGQKFATPDYKELQQQYEDVRDQRVKESTNFLLKDKDRLDRLEEQEAALWKAAKGAQGAGYATMKERDDFNKFSTPIDRRGGTVSNYINDKGKSREDIDNNKILAKSGEYGKDELKTLSYMSNDEKAQYNYILRTQGGEAAKEFLDWSADTRNQRRGAEIAESMKGNQVGEILYGIATGAERAASGAKQLFNKDAVGTSYTQYAGQGMREDLGPVGRAAHDILSSTANMAPSILASVASGGLGAPAAIASLMGSGAMALTSGGNAYNEKLQEGYTPGQARNFAMISGAMEGGLQYALGGISKLGGTATKAIGKKVAGIENGVARFVLTQGSNMASEGLEEGLQEFLSPVVESLVLEEDYEPAQMSDIMYSALLGALTVGVFELPGGIADEVSTRNTGRELLTLGPDTVQAVIDRGMEQDAGTTAQKISEKLSQKQAAGEAITPYALGRVYRDVAFSTVGGEKRGGTLEPDSEPEAPTWMEQPRTGMMKAATVQRERNLASSAQGNDLLIQAAMELAGVSEPDAGIKVHTLPVYTEEGTYRQTRGGMVSSATNRSTAVPASFRTAEQADYDLNRTSQLASTLGESGSRAFRTAYDRATAEQVPLEQAFEGFAQVYQSALTGKTLTETGAQKAAALPAHLYQAAEMAGRNDGRSAAQARYFGAQAGLVRDAAYKSARLDSRASRTLDAIAKAAGVQVRFFDRIVDAATGREANAKYENGIITIARNADDPVRVAFTHEIVHRIREVSPEAYMALSDFVRQNMSGTARSAAEALYQEGYQTTDSDVITEELVADAFGQITGEGSVLEQFVRDNRTAGQKILDAVRDFLNRIRKALGKGGPDLTAEQRTTFKELEQKISDMERMLAGALERTMDTVTKNAGKDENGQKNTATDGGGKFSIKKTQSEITKQYQNSVDDILNGTYGTTDSVLIGYTPEVYLNLKMPKLPFVIGPGHIYSASRTEAEAKRDGRYNRRINYHGLGVSAIKNIYQAASDPIIVISAKDVSKNATPLRSTHSVVSIIDIGSGSNHLLLPIEITASRTVGGMRMDVNVLSSAYEKNVSGLINEAVAQENSGEIGVYYIKKEARTLVGAGVQFPKRLTDAMASDNIVRVLSEKVNMSILEQVQSQQFKRWFGDWQNNPAKASKAVDAKGNPQVLYHQTDSNFTVFETKAHGAGETDSETPSGIFLKPTQDDIGLKGQKQMPLYANIRNPLAVDTREELAAWYRKNVSGYAEAETKIKEIDAQFSKEYEAAEARGDAWYEENYEAYAAGGISEEDAERHINGEIDQILTKWKSEEKSARLAAKKLLDQYFKGSSFDGVHIKNDAGSFGRSVETWVAFDSRQVKSADENIGTFDGSNPDIRYSLKGMGELERQVTALEREKESLRERVDYWKGQTKLTKQVTTDKKSVEKAAKALAKEYGARVDTEEVAGALQSLYDYIASGKDGNNELTYTEARRRANEIAGQIVENSVTEGEMYQEYKGLLDYMKNNVLQISQQDQAEISDFSDFRRRAKGVKIRTGKTNIDSIYQELSINYPEFFHEQRESNIADQIIQISEVIATIQGDKEVNQFSGQYDQAIIGVSNEILETFFDLPQTRKTFADVQAGKLEQTKIQGAERLQKVRENKNKQIALLRDRNKISTRKAIEKERARRNNEIQKLKEKYRETNKTKIESRNAREIRAKIIRHANELSQKLLRPSNKQHIPEDLRAPVASLLKAINMESQYAYDPETGARQKMDDGLPTKRTQAFRDLKEEYSKILAQDSGEMTIDPSLFGSEAEGVQGLFDKVLSMADTRITDMKASDLQTIWETLKAVETSISNAGKTLASKRFETTIDWARKMQRDAEYRKQRNAKFTIDLETPVTFYSHLGEAGEEVYTMMRDGQDKRTTIIKEIVDLVQRIIPKDFDVRKIQKQHKTYKLNNGQLTLTTAHAMSLYATYQRPQGKQHLLIGGIVQPEVKAAKVRAETDAIRLSQSDLDTIFKSLSEEQKKIATEMQKVLSGKLAEYGNEASMTAYGYKKFTEPVYWPLKAAQAELKTEIEKSNLNVRSIANIGMAKSTIAQAGNALQMGDFFDVFTGHVADMASYAAYLCPMEDAQRLFNFRFKEANELGEMEYTGKTVKGILDKVGGQKAQQYWLRLMADIQNDARVQDTEVERVVNNTVGRTKAAAVGANLRVVAQQPTAILRAASVLNPAYMAKGIAKGVTRGSGWAKAKKYAPIAQWKDWGSFDIGRGQQLSNIMFNNGSKMDKANDAFGFLAGKADAITWGKIWNACEWQTRAHNKALVPGTTEFDEKTAELFSKVINETQVVDGVLQRSQIMRSNSSLIQQATSFMGEPIMSYNLLVRALDKVRYDTNPKTKALYKKKLARSVFALLSSQVLNTFVQSIVDGYRDDDRDKTYWDRLVSAATGITGEEETTLDKVKGVALNSNLMDNINPIGWLPFAKDILSLVQGYEVSRVDADVIGDIIKAAQESISSISGEGKKTIAESTANLIAAAAKLFGVPAYNIKRDMMGILRTATQGNLSLEYELQKYNYKIGEKKNISRFAGIMYDAKQKGDTVLYDKIYNDMMAAGMLPKDIEKALKGAHKEEKGEDYTANIESYQDVFAGYDIYQEEEKKNWLDTATPQQQRKYYEEKEKTYNEIISNMDDIDKLKLSAEYMDKLSGYIDSISSEIAKSIADDKYAIDTKWINMAAGGDAFGVDKSEAALFKLAYEMSTGDPDPKDKEKVIKGSKQKNTLALYEKWVPETTAAEQGYLLSGFFGDSDKVSNLDENKKKIYYATKTQKYDEIINGTEGRKGLGVDDDSMVKLAEAAAEYTNYLAMEKADPGAEKKYDWYDWAGGGKKAGVDETEAILFRVAYYNTQGEKDSNGKTIKYSKKNNVLEKVKTWMPWLTASELSYLRKGFWDN